MYSLITPKQSSSINVPSKALAHDHDVSPVESSGMAATRRVALGVFLAGCVPAAFAQFRVEVSGVGLTQLPIAVAPFRGDVQSPQKIGLIIKADLERSGMFRSVGAEDSVADENTRPDLTVWRQKLADSLVTGSVTRLADGRFDVKFRLWDIVRGQDLGGQSYSVNTADLRLSAHKIADFVYEKLTGEKGIFSTRIAYVTKNSQRFNLWIADSDGEGGQSALTSPEPIISPAWSPSGSQLAYVSFESRKPVIYAHDIASGRRRLLANFRGSNSAPAWSPDGRQLIATLSREGGSQIFSVDLNGAEPQRLMQSSSIDTEPAYASDGKSIYFVSDRGGAPQIYRIAVTGGNAERITFGSNYNISPALSPDGKWMAYISRIGGGFKLHVLELATGNTTAISDTNADESPSFAPNSKLIVYATQREGREALMTTTLDGKISARLVGAVGDIREPAWAPFTR